MDEVKLSEEQEARIVNKAAKQATEMVKLQFFAEVGRTFVTRFLVIIGVVVVAFAAGKGWIELPKGK